MERTHLRQTLLEGLETIPLLDIHTHLDASHLAARGLHDILLYHMLISDLVSAGCPSRALLIFALCSSEYGPRFLPVNVCRCSSIHSGE